MKKVLLICAALLAGALAFGEATWTHSFGLGAATPFLSMDADDDGLKNVFAPQLMARYYAERSNGFCVQATLGAGCAMSESFKLGDDSDFAAGVATGLSFGAGWAFKVSEKLTFSALGSLSFDWSRFKLKKDITARLLYGSLSREWTETNDLLAFGIGAEILANCKLSDRLSLFISLAARFFDAGALRRKGVKEYIPYSSSYEIRGTVSVTPAVGVAWTF